MRRLLLCLPPLLCACTLTKVGTQYKVEGPLDIIKETVTDTKDAIGDAATDVQGAARMSSNPEDSYPKASEDATVVYELESNKERTRFYIDSKEMGVGRRLKVKINDREHTVVAHPEGCVHKEEFVRPPYNPYAPLRFTFLLGECKQ